MHHKLGNRIPHVMFVYVSLWVYVSGDGGGGCVGVELGVSDSTSCFEGVAFLLWCISRQVMLSEMTTHAFFFILSPSPPGLFPSVLLSFSRSLTRLHSEPHHQFILAPALNFDLPRF